MINILIVVIVILIISFIIGLIITGNGENGDNETKLTDNPSILFEDENTDIALKSNIYTDGKNTSLDIPVIGESFVNQENDQSPKDEQFDDEII